MPSQLSVDQRFSVPFYHHRSSHFSCHLVKALHVRQFERDLASDVFGGDVLLKTSSQGRVFPHEALTVSM